MAGVNYHAHPYIHQLNDYHCELVSVASVVSHLLDESSTFPSAPDWHKAACCLLQKHLLKLADELPFPPENFSDESVDA